MKKLSNILIVIGVLLLAAPFAGSWILEQKQAQMISEYEDSLNDSLAVNNLPAEVSQPAENAGDQPVDKEKPIPKKEPVKIDLPVVGRIRITKIKLDLPIIRGFDRKALRYGIGYLPGSGPLGGVGNAVLAGHRNYPFGRMFNRLDELKVGDTVIVEANKKTYRYVVYEKLVVMPSNVSVIKKMGDKKVLTLITCTPAGKDTQRLIIHASLE